MAIRCAPMVWPIHPKQEDALLNVRKELIWIARACAPAIMKSRARRTISAIRKLVLACHRVFGRPHTCGFAYHCARKASCVILNTQPAACRRGMIVRKAMRTCVGAACLRASRACAAMTMAIATRPSGVTMEAFPICVAVAIRRNARKAMRIFVVPVCPIVTKEPSGTRVTHPSAIRCCRAAQTEHA